MSSYQFDALVIGSGVAGLASAIRLGESGIKVGILTREKDPKISNTFWAQGGIIYERNDNSSPKEGEGSLIDDIFKASAGTSLYEAAQILQDRSGAILEDLLLKKAKTNFQRSENGELNFTMEACHSKSRILYQGDFTGREIQVSMLNYLNDKKRFPNVTFLTGHTAIDLLTPLHHGVRIQQRYEEPRVLGAYVFNQETGMTAKAIAKVTILATGGIGALYLNHSNSEGARGDGHAMAKRAGAIFTDMEFIQFHPTTFFDKSSHRRFLISEALRGEGGILVNSEGRAFMSKYHPDRELAPRDVVARSIHEEMIATRHECVYLDMTHKDADWVRSRFPTIFEHCLSKNVDMTEEPIPVVPAAHYTCGGVKTNLSGKTNLKGLYAVGEVACTGLHGANRLASTSLLEGLTFGYIAAENILESLPQEKTYDFTQIKDWKDGHLQVDRALTAQDWMTLKQTMWNYLGLTRSGDRLKRANAMLVELSEEIQRFYRDARLSDELIGLRNAVEVSQLVLSASKRNTESVGCFYRLP